MIEEFEENFEQLYMPVSYLPNFLYEDIKEKSIGLLVSYGGEGRPRGCIWVGRSFGRQVGQIF